MVETDLKEPFSDDGRSERISTPGRDATEGNFDDYRKPDTAKEDSKDFEKWSFPQTLAETMKLMADFIE